MGSVINVTKTNLKALSFVKIWTQQLRIVLTGPLKDNLILIVEEHILTEINFVTDNNQESTTIVDKEERKMKENA